MAQAVSASGGSRRSASGYRNPWRFRIAAMLAASAALFGQEVAPESRVRGVVRDEINRAALRHRIDPRFADAVAKVESGYAVNVTSRKGAVGVMQLMPDSARKLGVNPWDYRQNIEGGVRYLRMLLERYQGDVRRTLAAYNAGTGPVELYGGVPPYRETRAYVDSVLSGYSGRRVPASRVVNAAKRGKPTPVVKTCRGVEVALDAGGRLYYRRCDGHP